MHRPQGVSEEAFTKFIFNKHIELKPVETFVQHYKAWLNEAMEEIREQGRQGESPTQVKKEEKLLEEFNDNQSDVANDGDGQNSNAFYYGLALVGVAVVVIGAIVKSKK